MTLRLYAVMPEKAYVQVGKGAGGTSLHSVARHGLKLVYDQRAQGAPATREEMLAYGAVIQRLCETKEALPFRYGATLSEEGDALKLLDQRSEEWTRQLSSVRGLSEFIVHLEGKPSEKREAQTGTGYLASRAKALRAAREAEKGLASLLREQCRSIRMLSSFQGMVRLACLAPPESLSTLRERLKEWLATHPNDEEPQITGPWPPFSFAEREDEDG